jgi:hypothetical protein
LILFFPSFLAKNIRQSALLINKSTDSGGSRKIAALLQRFLKTSFKPFEGPGDNLISGFGHQNGKFITPHAYDDICGASITLEGNAQGAEEPVAPLVAKMVVYFFKIVAIQVY